LVERFDGLKWARQVLVADELGLPVEPRDIQIARFIMEQYAILQVHNEIFELFNDLEIDELIKRSKKGLKLAWSEIQKAVQKRMERETQRLQKQKEKTAQLQAV